MKKPLVLLLLFLLVAIGVAIYLCISFFGLYRQAQETEATVPSVSSTQDLEDYVTEQWHFDRADYDRETQTLTALRSYSISYEQACLIGPQVFVDELSPESYLPLALTMAADLSGRFALPRLRVAIVYESSDGQTVFSADSEGVLYRCWTEPTT